MSTKCPQCKSMNTDNLTKNYGKTTVKGAIFCYGCGKPTYYN